jgi:hypothetical protein
MRHLGIVLAGAAALAFVDPAWAIDLSRISINGYTSLEIERQLEGDGEGAGDPNLSFDADLFDLVVNFQVSDRIRAAADFTWEHGPASEDARGNVAVEYGFIEYAFSDFFKVRFGKMFIPFGVYNEIHTAKPAFLSVKEPSSTNKAERIVEAAIRFYPRWGAGIALQGNAVVGGGYLDYNLMISNGEQEETNPFEEDNNTSKAITARIRLEPATFLRLGSSMYYDKLDSESIESLRSHGFEIELFLGRLQILSEAMVGFSTPREGNDIRQLGWYVQPSYRFPSGFTPYLRIEHIDPDLDAEEDQGLDLVAGLNVTIDEWFMIKLENHYFKGGDQSSLTEFPGSDYNELKAAVVLGF